MPDLGPLSETRAAALSQVAADGEEQHIAAWEMGRQEGYSGYSFAIAPYSFQ